MKTRILFISLILFGAMPNSCKKDSFSLKNPDADQFVHLVKEGDYFTKVGYELPEFSVNDIGKLLSYAMDTSIVKEFPANPVSSKYTTPKILCECILWTIEGIRLGNKYPSLEPSLVDTTVAYVRLSNKQLIEQSEIYINWYNEYKRSPSETLLKKKLLKGNYIWH